MIKWKTQGKIILIHKINWFNTFSYINEYNYLNKVLKRLKISQEIINSNDFLMDLLPVTRVIGNKTDCPHQNFTSKDSNMIYDQIDYMKDIFNHKSLKLVTKCQTIHLNQFMKYWNKINSNIIARELIVWYEKLEGEKLKL